MASSKPSKTAKKRAFTGAADGFRQLDARTQSRLDELLEKGNEGELTAAESQELNRLVEQTERLVAANARHDRLRHEKNQAGITAAPVVAV